ncbi:MAG: hypothetical protein LUG55_11355 [Clostridiales bacterium]|nr:hypothetical protein [Clostridiales bacterium]
MKENEAKILTEIAAEMRRENGEETDEILALEAGAKALYNREDRNACAAMLALGAAVLGAVAIVSAVGGVASAFLGDLKTAGAMLPYVVFPAALATLMLRLAGR